MIMIWIFLALVVGVFLWNAISPRSQWWVFQAWALSNPEANEPSDLAYAVSRVVSVGAIIAIVVSVIALAII